MELVGNGQRNPTALLSQFRTQEQKNRGEKQKTNIKIVELTPNVSIITLNINGLNPKLKDSTSLQYEVDRRILE